MGPKLSQLKLNHEDAQLLVQAKRHIVNGSRLFFASLKSVRRERLVPGSKVDIYEADSRPRDPEDFPLERRWSLFLGHENAPSQFEKPLFVFKEEYREAFMILHSIAESNLAAGIGSRSSPTTLIDDFTFEIETNQRAITLTDFLAEREIRVVDMKRVEIAAAAIRAFQYVYSRLVSKGSEKVRSALDLAALEGRYPTNYYYLKSLYLDRGPGRSF